MASEDGIDHGDRHRDVVSSHRRDDSSATGTVAAFWIAVLAIAFAVFRIVTVGWPSSPIESQRPVESPALPAPAPAPLVDPSRRAAFGASVAPPSAAAPIYRCGSHYSDRPCAGGRTVDSAVVSGFASGFKSRPSERLARLVAEGRATNAAVTTEASVSNADATGGRSIECPSLASEVVAIDNAARLPQSASGQDRLRVERRRVRDRQNALHC